MQDYMGDRVMIGGYTIDGIEMLDDSTCAMYFEEFQEGDVRITIVVEKWIDDNTFHFMDSYCAENGYFIGSEDDTTHLSEDEKEECKRFINEWLESLEQ